MAQKGVWERVKTGGKAGFDKTWQAMDKLGAPVNKLSNRLGSEAFWPTSIDKECDKAARILRSFCKDGFYDAEKTKSNEIASGPTAKQRVIKKIPASVIRNAMGIAIFTVMRTGLWFSGAGGSGVLLARKEDGMWSPPSGILLHTAGLGFLIGVDIYDCVVILNTQEAVDAFTKVRCTLGGELTAVAGPAGVGGVIDTEVHKRQAPLFTYLKSRGFYAGVQVDGTVIIERTDENERFYGYRVGVADILAGKVRHPPYEINGLMETLRAAQGESNIDDSLLPEGPPPADYEVVAPQEKVFGIPDAEDEDPYGVRALEAEGLQIKEAGTQKVAPSDEFEFRPNPTSPASLAYRQSWDEAAVSRRASWRNSSISSAKTRPISTSTSFANHSGHERSMSSASTQTDIGGPIEALGIRMEDNEQNTGELGSRPISQGPPHALPPRLPPRGTGTDRNTKALTIDTEKSQPTDTGIQATKEADAEENQLVPQETETSTTTDHAALDHSSTEAEAARTSIENAQKEEVPSSDTSDDEDGDAEFEEPVVFEVQKSPLPQVISRPRVVNVAKSTPPLLPPRNPGRSLRSISPDSARDHAGSVNARGEPGSPTKSFVSDMSFKSASSRGQTHENALSPPSPPTRPASSQAVATEQTAPSNNHEEAPLQEISLDDARVDEPKDTPVQHEDLTTPKSAHFEDAHIASTTNHDSAHVDDAAEYKFTDGDDTVGHEKAAPKGRVAAAAALFETNTPKSEDEKPRVSLASIRGSLHRKATDDDDDDDD